MTNVTGQLEGVSSKGYEKDRVNGRYRKGELQNRYDRQRHTDPSRSRTSVPRRSRLAGQNAGFRSGRILMLRLVARSVRSEERRSGTSLQRLLSGHDFEEAGRVKLAWGSGRWMSKQSTRTCQIAGFRQERYKGLIGCSMRR